MAKRVKNQFDVQGDTVLIHREGWPCSAQCTYRDDYYPELTSHTWGMDKNHYPHNNTLGGGLHRYMMKKWYGEDTLEEFTKNGYVVDHINNEHSDCRISNLEFLKKDYNTAKGQQLDKDIERLRLRLAIGIFKDFQTDSYQITIGCNDYICGQDNKGNRFAVDSFKLLYSGDYNVYPIVLNDAEGILLSYEKQGIIDPHKTNASCVRVYHAPQIKLTEEEKQQAVVTRDGIPFIIIGNGKSYMHRIAPDREWTIPKDCNGKQLIEHMIPHWFQEN